MLIFVIIVSALIALSLGALSILTRKQYKIEGKHYLKVNSIIYGIVAIVWVFISAFEIIMYLN